jgi:hypothetical protein
MDELGTEKKDPDLQQKVRNRSATKASGLILRIPDNYLYKGTSQSQVSEFRTVTVLSGLPRTQTTINWYNYYEQMIRVQLRIPPPFLRQHSKNIPSCISKFVDISQRNHVSPRSKNK